MTTTDANPTPEVGQVWADRDDRIHIFQRSITQKGTGQFRGHGHSQHDPSTAVVQLDQHARRAGLPEHTPTHGAFLPRRNPQGAFAQPL
jgi:hypothetical protein